MEDATAVLSATECATSYASTGADHYVNESGEHASEAQAAHGERTAPRKAKRAKRDEAVSRRRAIRTDQTTAAKVDADGEAPHDGSDPTHAPIESTNSNDKSGDALNCAASALTADDAETDSAPAAELCDTNQYEADVPDKPATSAPVRAEVQTEVEAPPTAERIIEALLFASDAPLSAARLADLVGGVTPAIVNDCIDLLNADYTASGRAFRITSIAGGYQMLTTSIFQPWLAKLDKHRGQNRLGDAALEVLSIIAYKQPIIRSEVEAIRGVACGEVMNRLRDMGLIKAVGRAEVVGRPLLYGTTRKFLDAFGLEKLEDLPPLEAIQLKANPSNSG